MTPLFGFIVSPYKGRYNNKVDVDGKELIVNTEITERDAEFVSRIGIVNSTPSAIDTPIKVGDKVIVHHNVFRRWFDQYQRERNGRGFISDDEFLVFADQIFGYNDGSGWKSCPGYVFVKPIENDNEWMVEIEKPLYGELLYTNDDVGIPVGDIVAFKPGSEYEFVIDGQKLYRIYSTNLTIHGLQEGKTKDNRISEEVLS